MLSCVPAHHLPACHLYWASVTLHVSSTYFRFDCAPSWRTARQIPSRPCSRSGSEVVHCVDRLGLRPVDEHGFG